MIVEWYFTILEFYDAVELILFYKFLEQERC